MDAKIKTETIEHRVIFSSPYHSIEFDNQLAEKKYPFAIGLYNYKYDDEIITEIESSKIVKIDPDLSYYHEEYDVSTIYLVPQSFFDVSKFKEIIYTLLKKLAEKIESS